MPSGVRRPQPNGLPPRRRRCFTFSEQAGP